MSRRIAPDALMLDQFVRPGDAIVWGQGTGEPTTLIETLIAQKEALPEVSAFAASSFSGLLTPERMAGIAMRSMGAIGALRSLTKAGQLDIIPCHVGQVGRMIADDTLACDVAFVQVSPPDADGNHSYGLINDFTQDAVAKARIVIAEVNDLVPFTRCDALLPGDAIDVLVEVSREPVSLAPAAINDEDRAIAAAAAAYIDDGSVLQMGVGSVPDALMRIVADRRDLGIHSGMVSDALVDLVETGAVTDARKPFDAGVSVTGALIGSRRLYDFAHGNDAIRLCSARYTHDAAVLASIPKLVTINSAVEIDLTGQVNAEGLGNSYFGGTGGQVDYVRAGARSPGGRSLIVLPSTAQAGAASRIVPLLHGPVTTARSEVDVVITEFGTAELKGQSLAERARRLVRIAHPDFRERLDEAAHIIASRGF